MPTGRGSTLPLVRARFLFPRLGTNLSPGRAEEAREGSTPLRRVSRVPERGVNVKRGLAGKVRKGWRPGVAKIGYLNNTSRERGDRGAFREGSPHPAG